MLAQWTKAYPLSPGMVQSRKTASVLTKRREIGRAIVSLHSPPPRKLDVGAVGGQPRSQGEVVIGSAVIFNVDKAM